MKWSGRGARNIAQIARDVSRVFRYCHGVDVEVLFFPLAQLHETRPIQEYRYLTQFGMKECICIDRSTPQDGLELVQVLRHVLHILAFCVTALVMRAALPCLVEETLVLITDRPESYTNIRNQRV